MRNHARMSRRTASRIRSAIALAGGLGSALVSAPAWAQTAQVASAGAWVSATLISVTAVFVLWAAASVFFVLARKLRWVSAHRHSRLSRAVQVTFGGLLLLAVLMPYLTMNHPLMAVAFLLGGLVLAGCFGSRRASFGGESQTPPSG